VDDVLVDDDLSKIGKAEEFTERTRKKTLREKLKEPGNVRIFHAFFPNFNVFSSPAICTTSTSQ
jgi:hypothetical protein